MADAAWWIEWLGLEPHPEGGYYRETYRAHAGVAADGFDGRRSAATAIYFLLTSDNFSALHRMKSDEVWFFHDGDPLTVHVITPEGDYRTHRVGPAPDDGQEPQAFVPAGCWFGATVETPGGFALVGCAVAPGFEFGDFELARREELIGRHPERAAIIERLTR